MTAPARLLTAGTRPAAALALLLWLLSSCVLSLHPLAENDRQVVFREDLLGTWQDSEGTSRYIAQRGAGAAYHILSIEEAEAENGQTDRDSTVFTGKLVQVGEAFFLDLVEAQGPAGTTSPAIKHLIVALALRDPDTLEVGFLDKGALEQLMEQKKIAPQYTTEGEDLLLQEPPALLQQLLAELLRRYPDAWERNTLHRM